MAKLPGKFNSEEHGEMGFDCLPKDDYLMQIIESEYKATSKNDGHYLMLKREIISGKYKGRFYFSNLNLDNPNPTAVEIANKEFAATCKACGRVAVEDSEELHGIPHIVALAVKAGKGNEPDRNIITSIKAAEGYEKPSRPKFDDEQPKAEKPAEQKRRPIFEDD